MFTGCQKPPVFPISGCANNFGISSDFDPGNKEICGAMFCYLALLIYLCGKVSKKGCQSQGVCPYERKGNWISVVCIFFISTQRYV
jgi:hypothetical protein